jgi:hypothetical protein
MTTFRVRLLCAGACGALVLAGCSAASQSTAPPLTGSPATRVPKKMKLVYVTDYNASVVLIYKQGDTGAGPIGEIVTGINSPQGDAVDKSGTLYVANEGNSTVTEYPPGASTPSVTLSSSISRPLDVSVDSSGIVYVMEGSAGKILEFKPGSTSPDATVSITHPADGTNAKNDDLYVTNNSSGGHVARCKPLATSCTDLGITVGYAQGVALDLHGNLLVGDIYGQVIDIYKSGQTNPYRQISTPFESPSKLALDRNDATLYQADPANFAVELYNYKQGTQESSFTFGSGGELEGVALSPGQKPGK